MWIINLLDFNLYIESKEKEKVEQQHNGKKNGLFFGTNRKVAFLHACFKKLLFFFTLAKKEFNFSLLTSWIYFKPKCQHFEEKKVITSTSLVDFFHVCFAKGFSPIQWWKAFWRSKNVFFSKKGRVQRKTFPCIWMRTSKFLGSSVLSVHM